MKKIFIALIVLLIILTTASCGFVDEILLFFNQAGNTIEDSSYAIFDDIIPTDKIIFPSVDSTYETVTQKYGYESLLDDDQREAYNCIVKNIRSISTDKASSSDGKKSAGYRSKSINIPKMSVYSMDFVLSAIREDFPEAFWLTDSYYYVEKPNNIEFRFVSYLTEEEIQQNIAIFNEAIYKIISDMPTNLSEYDRALYLHDWIVSNCDYSTESVSKDFQDMDDASAFGVIVTGKSVCNGYARAYKVLLKEAGIHSLLINGTTSGSAHIWNAVRIDNKWYHTDVTWDDPTIPEDIKMNYYYYFNMNTEQISKTHTIFPMYEEWLKLVANQEPSEEMYPYRCNTLLPNCVSNDSNYYSINGITIDNREKEAIDEITQKIISMHDSNETSLSIVISEELDSKTTSDWLLNSAIHKSLKAANNNFSEPIYSMSSFSYYYDEKIRDDIVIVVLSVND